MRMRMCGVVGLALLASGCHVRNRLYNIATDPVTGSPRAESVVRATPGEAEPDVIDKDCPPKDHVCVAFLE